MAKWWTGDIVPKGENPLGAVQETANGTVRNGRCDDGYQGNYEYIQPEESYVHTGRNAVQPPTPPPDPFSVSVVAHVRRRRGM